MWQLNQQWQKEPLAEKISGLNNKKKPTERETKLGGERERERERLLTSFVVDNLEGIEEGWKWNNKKLIWKLRWKKNCGVDERLNKVKL